MTDTTDTAALVVDMRGRAITRINNGGYAEISVKATDLILILDQLEAERQQRDAAEKEVTYWCNLNARRNEEVAELRERAEKAELELIKPLPIGELIQRLEGQTYEKWFSQSDLKGDQVPVAWIVHARGGDQLTTDGDYVANAEGIGGIHSTPLFAAQQKPVISKEKLCDWLEDNFDIDDSQRDAFADCFAHNCECIVKQEGE